MTSGVSISEMHGHAPAAAKDTWIFNAEATSTLLIAAWYIFGVYITLGIIPKNAFYEWGAHWVISFLLGVFYLGAGYLYQRHQCVTSLKSSAAYLKREVIVLLTPFLAFLVLTLLVTSVASLQPGLIASGLAAGQPGFTAPNLMHALFVHPVGPVGYFIILLGIYVITHTPQTKRGMWTLFACALVAKMVAIVLTDLGVAAHAPYYLLGIMDNWIWFALGIALCTFDIPKRLARPAFAAGLAAAFIVLGALLLAFNIAEAGAFRLAHVVRVARALCAFSSKVLAGKTGAFLWVRYALHHGHLAHASDPERTRILRPLCTRFPCRRRLRCRLDSRERGRVLDRLLSTARVRDVGALSHRQIGLHRLPQPLSTRFVRQITRVVAIGLWGYARHVNQEEYERSMPEPLMLPTQANDHPENGTFSPLLKRA